MEAEADPDLIDRIYEGAFVPGLWPSILDGLSAKIDAFGGVLFSPGGGKLRWTASEVVSPFMDELIREGWMELNQRAPRLRAMNYPGFVGDYDVFTPEEHEKDPLVSQFLRPRGFGFAAGTIIDNAAGDIMVFSLERRFARGPIDDEAKAVLDRYRPHLARAAQIAVRFELDRARAAAETLDLLGLPAVVITASSRILAMNPLFEELIPSIFLDKAGHLTAAHPEQGPLIPAGIEAGLPMSSAIRPSETTPAMIAHVLPVRRAARDVFSGASFILVATPVKYGAVPSEHVVSALFDLSPAEARVACSLAEGATVSDVSNTFGLSPATVRTQLKAVFAKTGLSRQADLVGFLTGSSLPIFK